MRKALSLLLVVFLLSGFLSGCNIGLTGETTSHTEKKLNTVPSTSPPPRKYYYIPGETEFTFQLNLIGNPREYEYKLTNDKQLIFTDLTGFIEPIVIDLNDEEVEYLAGFILSDHSFHNWKNGGTYSHDEYQKVKTDYSKGISILTVVYNDDKKTIGGYSSYDQITGTYDSSMNSETREIIRDIYSLLQHIRTRKVYGEENENFSIIQIAEDMLHPKYQKSQIR